MINVIMHGCNGRMGRVITDLIKEDKEVQIVAGIDRYNEIENDYPVFADMQSCDVKADVIIDFSNAQAVDSLMDYCSQNHVPVVVCSTGLSQEQLNHLEEVSKTTAVLKSANMSLGINTIMQLLQQAIKVLAPAGFDVEIVEKHHNQKLDAPSGTALYLADAMNEVMENQFEYVYDRSKERKKRSEHEMGISAVRGGSIVGEHEVLFAGIDEVIEIKHTAYSRAIFGKGAIEAAKYLKGKTSGFYDMQNVIKKRD